MSWTWLPQTSFGWTSCLTLAFFTGYFVGVVRENRRMRRELSKVGAFNKVAPAPPPPLPKRLDGRLN